MHIYAGCYGGITKFLSLALKFLIVCFRDNTVRKLLLTRRTSGYGGFFGFYGLVVDGHALSKLLYGFVKPLPGHILVRADILAKLLQQGGHLLLGFRCGVFIVIRFHISAQLFQHRTHNLLAQVTNAAE